MKENMENALLIVPHQDDETNLAGNIIDRIKIKYNLYILYSSLDTVPEKGRVRKHEAYSACGVWGISADHLIFLDYPDSPNKVGHHYYTDGDHRIENDLKEWILNLRPAIILATDFDYHSDHRMLSVAFETAMGKILRERPAYRPVVLKGFCYETAYYSVEDYKASKPQNSVSNINPLSNPSYEWDKRVSIKSTEHAGVIWHRKAYKALKAHRSQYAILHAKSVVNQDNVFWERISENLLFCAQLSSSAEGIEKIRDFKVLDTDDFITKDSRKIDYHIASCLLEKGDWIKAEWNGPVCVDRIIFHGSINQNKKRDTRILIKADGNAVGEIKELMPYGRDTIAHIQIMNVKVLELLIYDEVELSEIEMVDDTSVRTIFENILTPRKANRIIDVIDYWGYNCVVLWTRLSRKLAKICKL